MLSIGSIQLESPFILAPLAGYTDLAFRRLCREFGAGLCVSEMISCHGLTYQQPNTIKMLASHPEEKPVSFQLFGADPDIMGEASNILSEYSPDIIDINMGCPVKKVTKKGAGAALMKDPVVAEKVIKSVVSNTSVPVTVKIRSGVNGTHINSIEFSKMIEDCGASAIIIHGRTWAQGFTGHADWNSIEHVKRTVSIPVIGNGDITHYDHGVKMMNQTGCDGVMIGRAALGNPWIFQKKGKPRQLGDILVGVQRHLQLMETHLKTEKMIGVIKNHIGRYFKSLPGSSYTRKIVYECQTFQQLKKRMSVDFLSQ